MLSEHVGSFDLPMKELPICLSRSRLYHTPILIISAFFWNFFFERARAINPFTKCFCPNNSTTTHYDYIDYRAIATS